MRTRMEKLLLIAPLAILGILVFIFLGGEIVKLLWNWLLPPLVGWPQVTFWQALGMLALCRILFGGCGLRGGHYGRGRFGHRLADRVADRVADRMGERWQQMTPEERERFRQRMRERWGFDPGTGSDKTS